MKLFRHHILSRLFCVLMAFHIFNMSVDTADPDPNSVPEDLSYNDMESVVEIVLEKMLGYDNAIEEQDEPGDENAHSQAFEMQKEFKYCNLYTFNFSFRIPVEFVKMNISYNEEFICSYSSEITPPPPKA